MNTTAYLRYFYLAVEPVLFAPFSRILLSKTTRMARSLVAQKYLEGSGLEIGAFASPTLAPLGVKVRYVDRVSADYWADNEEYRGVKIVEPDVIDDGATLSTILNDSQDFVVSFQMLEHVPNTMETLKNWIRVIKPGGLLVISVPDKRYTRDRARQTTSLEHFVHDFEHGPQWGAEGHYRDVGQNVLGLSQEDLDAYVEDAPPAIHFHVWDTWSFVRFLDHTNNYFGRPLDLLHFEFNHKETIAVLQRKRAGTGISL